MKHLLKIVCVIGAAALFLSAAYAQPKVEVYATGLLNPIGIAVDARGNLWVGEQGTGSGYTGTLSIVRPGGQVHQFMTGFPSTAPGYEPISVEHVVFDTDGKLLVLTGGGPDPYSEAIIVVDTAGFVPGSPARTVAERDTLYNIGGFVRADGAIPNPYRIAVGPGGDYYIVDASYNALLRRDRGTGTLSVVKKFPPIGPVEAVPTGLAYDGQKFYVGTLTGIPIPTGAAVVYTVDSLGATATFRAGFSSIVDVALNPTDGSLFVLQHARFANGWVNGTGALLRVRGSYTDTLITGMNRPAGMAFGPDGTLYITSVSDDNVLKVTGLNTVLEYSRLGLAYGPVMVTNSDTLSFRVRNLDSLSRSLTGVTVPGSGFSLVNPPAFPKTIPARGDVTFRVAFHPASAGSFTDSLVFTSDDAARPRTSIQLTGAGKSITALAQPAVMYAVQAGAPLGTMNTLNTSAGTATLISSFGLPSVDGLAVRRGSGELFGAVTSGTGTAFYRINPATGEAGLLRRLPIPNMPAIVFGNGDTLYGGDRSGRLYAINLTNGSYQPVGVPSGVPYYAFAISPTTGRLWASARAVPDTSDTLYSIDRSTGAVSRVGSMQTGIRAAIAFDTSGALYGLTGGSDGPNLFISINAQTGEASLIGSETFNNFAAIVSRLDGTVTAVEQTPALPESYALSQNYPNPFNPSTVIRYEVPRSAGEGSGQSVVRLVVYDLLGREVATLVNERQSAGAYVVRWDAGAVASGVYFYTLAADGVTRSRKMVLAR